LLRYESATIPTETARQMTAVLDQEFMRISQTLGCSAEERVIAIVQSRDAFRKSTDSAEWVVNVQGDEPLIDPGAIDAAILPLLDEPSIPMGTLKKRIEDPREIGDPNVVKVVTDRVGNAIYFSRSTIPNARDGAKGKSGGEVVHYKHIGLYIYRRDFLLRYPELPVGPLEMAERLEQLRALENGHQIRVVETEYESVGVDTPEDLQKVNQLFEASLAGVIQNG